VLGKHVTQAGSLVAPDYLRFDFTHSKPLSPEEIREVERIVNEQIMANTEVEVWEDIPLEEARKRGAMALFGEKYGDRVRMIQIGDFSLELCGGTHLPRTGHAGLFKIIHEGSAASGIRRIEAVTGRAAYDWVQQQNTLIKQAAALVKSNPLDLVGGIERLLSHQKELQRSLEKLRAQAHKPQEIKAEQVDSVELVVQKLEDGEMKEATYLADRLAEGHPKRVVVVALQASEKPGFVCKVGLEAQRRGAHAGNLIREIAKMAGGGGGGRQDFATAGAKDPTRIETALNAAKEFLQAQIRSI
jgi:alanyl-tRNA synthetase